jgi:hypothetical protein
VPVIVLFGSHDTEFVCLGGESSLQTLGEVIINPRILFFEGDGEGKYFLFCQTLK